MVDFFLDEIENVLELDYAVEREFLHLNRNYHLVSRRQSVHNQYSERGQAVDEEIIVILRYAVAGNRLVKNLLAAHRLGKKHLISIESDRDADYNLYFQMQNQLMEAYSQLRNETAQKKYHRDYALLNNDQKEQVRNICPQRITESYANAMTHADQRVDANAEEKQGEENSTETATEQQKGGKQ